MSQFMTPAKQVAEDSSRWTGQVLKPRQGLLQLTSQPGNFNMRQLGLRPRSSHRIHWIRGLSLELKDPFEAVIRDASEGEAVSGGTIRSDRRH